MKEDFSKGPSFTKKLCLGFFFFFSKTLNTKVLQWCLGLHFSLKKKIERYFVFFFGKTSSRVTTNLYTSFIIIIVVVAS